MLVLSRHQDEEIVVETPLGRMTIGVVEIRGDKVRLGFTAPKEIVVHRSEVAERIARKKSAGEN